MKSEELLNLLQNIGKDPSRLIFEDELTGIHNRRFLLNYFQYKVPWDALETHPLSLIMMDVDHFKQINDTYGHQVGDQTLIRVAGLLKEMAGEESLAIRYAGDEFMILMPQREKKAALQMGESLLQKVRQHPMRIGEIDQQKEGDLRISFSVGIASAPEDAQTGKGLIEKADTALYYAKKSGRDRLANAAEIAPQDVFPKAALYQLETEKIAGRRQQLGLVSDLLKKFSHGQNQFLIVEGPDGMGKSTFLEAIRRNLADNRMIRLAKVSGSIQELFSPYYMTTKIMVELLNLRPDGGVGVFEKLSAKEIAYLANILPQLEGMVEVQLEDEPKAVREGIFNTLLHFIPQVIESLPLVLLIDDLEFIDEASLIFLRQLFLSQQFPLFLCGTSPDPREIKLEKQEIPLDIFYAVHHQELEIRKISLTPLTSVDIADHLQGAFPQIRVPPDFEKHLEQITHGNPLFLGEILHQLVMERKITLMGQQWVIETLAIEDLPKSLEAIINQKIAALDEESRGLLHQASIFGENVPLSLLTGGSEKQEAQVLEFVDQATAQGLIRSDFQLNDETIRFRGKRVLDITDKDIQPEQKRKLHERIANYQETLYQQRLLLSAAPLAYHFQRADNQEKARTYEQFQAGSNEKVFNSQEASLYSGETGEGIGFPTTPLDEASLALVPTVIRCLLTSLRNIKLYPPGSESVVSAIRQVKEAIDPILAKNESLALFKVKQALMINGQEIPVSEYKLAVGEFSKLLDRVQLQGIVFYQGLTDNEIKVLVESLSRIKPQLIDKDYWRRFSAEHQQLVHIDLKQVQYTVKMGQDRGPGVEGTSPEKGPAAPRKDLSQLIIGQQKLDREEWAQVPDIMRALLTATRNIKIYPLNSKAVTSSIQQLREALQSILSKWHVLTLAQVSNSLVVNRAKIEPTGIEWLVEGVRKFLDSIKLTSLTFVEGLSTQELKTFLDALSQLPISGMNPEFWARFSVQQGLSSILFDQVLYEARQALGGATAEEETGVAEEEKLGEVVGEIEPVTEELFDAFLKALPGRVSDLLLAEDQKQVEQMIQWLFKGFQDRTFATREKVIESCRRMLEDMTLAVQHRFGKLLASPLLAAFEEEKNSEILREIAALLHRMATILVQFAEYSLASRILSHLSDRHQQLEEVRDPNAQRLAKILDRKLEPYIQKLLIDDLRSGENSRRENAVLLLGSLGKVSIPLLIEVIKKTEDLRVRQLAAGLLGQMGSEGTEPLKRELVLGGRAEERSRILEVIDTVTNDLKVELAYALGDGNVAVRQAALQLAERLDGSQAINLLLDYAKGQETALAVEAIECLGRLKTASAVNGLVSLLSKSKEKARLIACCHALGQIADPASIEPLAKILTRKGFFARRRVTAEVRAAAIFALAQISHPQVAKVLALFADDSDPRVREIAQAHVGSGKLPSHKSAAKE